MLLSILGLTLAALAYTVILALDSKETLMAFKDDLNAKLDAQAALIAGVATAVAAELAGSISAADATALLAKVDANSTAVAAIAPAQAPTPAPAP